MTTTAILLAAGMGTRLKYLTETIPKALIKVNNKPIIFYTIQELLHYDEIQEIVVVVGYKAVLLKNAITKEFSNHKIRFVENEHYKITNNMYSLLLALTRLMKTCTFESSNLIMNADVLFDPMIIHDIIQDPRGDLIACKPRTYLDEAMKITVADGKITSISKTITRDNAYGVSIDLYKFSGIEQLTYYCKTLLKGDPNQWSEVAIDRLLRDNLYNARPFDIGDNIWWEVDNKQDLQIAELLWKKEIKMAEIISKKIFVFDYDGTLVLDDIALPGVRLFMAFLRNNNKKVILISNNSSRSIEDFQYLATQSLGHEFTIDEVMISTQATIEYLRANNITRVNVIGTSPFMLDLSNAGLKFSNSDPQMIVIGFDRELTYEKLERAAIHIQKGVPYIATHEDLACPTLDGFIPDAGAILQLMIATTNIRPIAILGKPRKEFLETIMKKYDVGPKDLVLFGDRLYTDIAMANNCGVTSAVVLTGDTKVPDLLGTNFTPNFVFKDFNDVIENWGYEIR